ncbi:ribose-phosphate diphosphokinase [Limosilactobacillus ingluviei]|uniref:ribose-phosphate diphosphokinase n=1 Tax=Limosilactobacillus ingluviei TaxID=148604 RepID=UPI0023F0BB07|nr:ribose-phosphate pyrophosphokinase [Limosilactobacillus ingluviei]
MTELKNAAQVRLFALNSNRPLAEKVAELLGLPLNECTVSHFADGEIAVTIDESVRGCEVYVIQAVSDPVNTNLMELLIMVDALRRASAKKVNVVMPYYGYARQDRKARSREPITAKLVANLLEMDQIDRLITIDLHAPQVQGFFDIPVDHLMAAPTLIQYFLDQGLSENVVIVAPDHAGVNLVRRFAELIGGAPIAIVDKRTEDNRTAGGEEHIPDMIIGDVKGKTAIVVDDIVDTGHRITASAALLKKFGAKDIYGVATHAVLSGEAASELQASDLKQVVVTDTIKLPAAKQFDKLVQLSVAPLIKGALVRIHNHESIHDLYKLPTNQNDQ